MKASFFLLAVTFVCVVATATPYKWVPGMPFPKAVIHLKNYTPPIELTLRPDAAPKTVANFIRLAITGFYSRGCEFYRNYPNFVLQGGNLYDPSNDTVPLEYNLPNAKYSVGLARGAALNTGSSEFFINVGNNTDILNKTNGGGYAVFGNMTGGHATFDKLIKLATEAKDGFQYKIVHPPRFERIEILTSE